MQDRNFRALIEARWAEGKYLCVGLDPLWVRLPQSVRSEDIEETLFQFCHHIVVMTHDIVCAYKPNVAFFEAHGAPGIAALKRVMEFIHEFAPGVAVILDGKRGDIGRSNDAYAEYLFDHLDGDAATVHPYLGAEALEPFLKRTDKGIFVLCRTSNPGAGEFQDLKVEVPGTAFDEIAQGVLVSDERFSMPRRLPLHEFVAYRVKYVWNRGRKNCGLVTGATFPEEIRRVRKIALDLPLLIPGIGTQGGDLEATVKAAGSRFIINSSSDIIFASSGKDFAQVAREKAQQLDGAVRALIEKETTHG